ncbi:MAG: type II toxin-antitoxin system ParD family antitoxin [Candidatus Thiodiazotropha taylori]|nr:type II toxin-antitoxin system ParD family antitoxin [Candidatus Thiodiazotropha taylori]MCG8051632.1 type II toxin-antitoxin system ParD family antitoxin [Candidatus Thiodiazotropha taylori]MCG8054745.1 type II toxin-antitoxin system ParD family antitoxin [Candidatus Thiodiazotropha taylori]MCW4313451.1 type II toxin-antitoxin system ParD family antitoxin [Candidatus Thiodiazotropha taylori]MCW4316570.1 type II toxin-antitoxin system ParD family antitoxin [Candidatus Thiodiazotropha taylori
MPMVKRTYSITVTLDQYVKDRVGSGEYASDSEYLRDLIRRDQDENKEIAYIRSKLIEAEQSGFTDKNKDQILAEIKERAKTNGKLQALE